MRPGNAPTEVGHFAEEPFESLLVRVLDGRYRGVLYVDPPDGPTTVMQLKSGVVRRARSDDGYALLGQVLTNAGVVMDTEIAAALGRSGLLGESLLGGGFIDERTLDWGLARQLILRVARVFGLPPETRFEFYDGHDAFAETQAKAARVDPLQILWVGLRTHAESSRGLPRTLARLGRARFRIRADVDVRRFGLSGDAVALAEALQKERLSLPEILRRGLAAEARCRALVYTLVLSRYLEVAPLAEPTEGDSGLHHAPSTPGLPRGREVYPSTIGEPDPLSPRERKPSGETPAATPRARPASGETPATPRARHPSGETPPATPRARYPSGETPAATPRARHPSGESLPTDEASSPEDQNPSQRGRDPASAEGADSAPDSSEGGAASPQRVAKIKLRRMAVKRPEPSEERPSSRPPAVDVPTRDEIATRLSQLESESAFDLLDLDPELLDGRTESEVTDLLLAAYEDCSRRWDPVLFAEHQVDLRQAVAGVHRAMRDAFIVLSDPERRAEQVVRHMGGEPTPRRPKSGRPGPPSSDSSAHVLRERALVALTAHRVKEAADLCDRACTLDPENVDLAATAAWVRAHLPDADLASLLLDLGDVIDADSAHVPARYYRSLLRYRLGDHDAARADLEEVLRLEPEHEGALHKLVEWEEVRTTRHAHREP